MKRNHLIIIAIAALVGLWMFSQSGNASTADCEGVYTQQLSTNTVLIDS